MHVEVAIVRPLAFDYSGPSAIATASLLSPPVPPWTLLGPVLGFLGGGQAVPHLSLPTGAVLK